ncbi:MAG: adenosylcobinamide amidohydrolase [Actinobacteria bacterium]|nr:adenosylcobinamide amidohydrolase [Actinomycetota bacterium]
MSADHPSMRWLYPGPRTTTIRASTGRHGGHVDVLHPQLRTHRHADASWPVLVWTAAEPVRAIASAPFGVGLVAFVPRPLSDAALVNAVATATEARRWLPA